MIRARLLAFAACLGGAGCAPAPASSAPPGVVLDATLPAPAAGASAKIAIDRTVTPPSVRSLITIRLPDEVACSVAAGSASTTVALSFSALRPPFATLRSARPVTAYIAEGSASSGIVIEGQTGGFFVRGVARAEDVRLFANRVSVFEGLVVPTATAALRVESARPDGLALSLEIPPELELSGASKVTGTLPCAVLGLTPEPFDPFENFFGVPSGTAELRPARVPIARSPGDKPAAALTIDRKTPRDVSVLDREKGQVKIAWAIRDVIVFGWVDAKSLAFGTTPAPRAAAIGLGTISSRSGCCEHVFVCRDEIPLQVDQDGFTGTVGTIEAGTNIRVGWTSDERHWLEPGASGLESGPGARLFVGASHVEGCQDLVERRR